MEKKKLLISLKNKREVLAVYLSKLNTTLKFKGVRTRQTLPAWNLTQLVLMERPFTSDDSCVNQKVSNFAFSSQLDKKVEKISYSCYS